MPARRVGCRTVACGAVLVAALALAVGCSGSTSGPAAPPPTDAAPSSAARPAPTTGAGPVPTFTAAAGDFYQVPDPLPPGDPGALIRVQQISDLDGTVVARVMYHSRDLQGRDRAVTGVVDYPTGVAVPADGWPVLSWDHGTTGISQSCAPSRLPQPGVPSFGTGGVHVATDYLGLGPDGETHPYLQKVTEARATVDIVRAVRNIPDAHAGDRWVVVGHSQGGHAALATGELAPTYAPELNLLGTVAIAPAAELTAKIPGESDLVPDIVTTIAIFGQAADHPGFRPGQFLSPEAERVAPILATGCLDQAQAFLVAVATSPGGRIFDRRLRDDAAGRKLLAANEVGTKGFDTPLLVFSGGLDAIVVPARIDALMRRLCSHGDTVERVVLPGDDHGSEPATATAQIKAWVQARFGGEPALTSCAR